MRSIQKRLDKCREHICPIAGILVVRLDEERFERCTNIGQGFVVPDEEATRIGCIQHVEGTSNMCLIAEARAMIGRRREPVIGWQRRGVSLGKVAEVVVRHGNRARRVDSHCRREGGPAGDLADRGRRAPGRPAVGRRGDHGLVDGSARESSVLPDHVQLSGARVDGDLGKARGGANGCARVRVGVRRRLLGRDDRRLRPGAAAVGRRDEVRGCNPHLINTIWRMQKQPEKSWKFYRCSILIKSCIHHGLLIVLFWSNS